MGSGLLVDGDAIVKVQLARRGSGGVEGDLKLKVLLAELSGGVGGLDAQGQDGTAADEERDGRNVDVADEVVGGTAVDACVGVPVVEDVVGEVDADAGRPLLRDGGDDDAGAEKVLQLEGKGGRVVRVVEEHGAHGRRAVSVLAVQSSVDVVQQAVANVNGLLRAAGD